MPLLTFMKGEIYTPVVYIDTKQQMLQHTIDEPISTSTKNTITIV